MPARRAATAGGCRRRTIGITIIIDATIAVVSRYSSNNVTTYCGCEEHALAARGAEYQLRQ